MDGSPVKTLGELCLVRPPKAEARNRLTADAHVSFLPMEDLGIDEKYPKPTQTRPLAEVEGGYTYFAEGDVLLAKITPCFQNGKLGVARGLLNGVGFGSSEFIVLRPNSALDREYLYYFLSRTDFREEGVTRMGGAVGQQRVPIDFVLGQRVPLPPLPEQRRIVGILDEAFAAISTAKDNTERNLQNVRDLFESQREQILNPPDGGWDRQRLAELCTIKHGFAFKSEYFVDSGEYVLLTPGNFFERGGYRDRGDKQKYYCGDIPLGFVLSEGDLLVAMTEQAAGLLGSPILVPQSGRFLHNQRLGLVEGKPGVPWINEFFFHVFNLRAVRQAIHDSGSGVKVRHTSPTKIGEVSVSLPPSVAIQRAVVEQLNGIQEQTERLESLYAHRLAALDALRKSLLHHAFTGQLASGKPVDSGVVAIPLALPLNGISTTDAHAGILAMACALHERHGKSDLFTHVKAEKIAHMVEARLGIDLGRTPVKDAAGPNDFNHLKKVEHRAKMAGFFDFRRIEGGAYRVQKLGGFDRLIERTRTVLGDRLGDVERLLEWMLPMTVRQAEIVATVYAAWNNLLLDGKTPTDEEIVYEARENWHPDKLKIERQKFFAAIEWLRKQGVVPDGKGRRVVGRT